MATKRKLTGGLLGVIGFMLSPLSWWNDAFVNLPLALGFAWLVSFPCPAAWRVVVFDAALIAGYWLTNVLGLVLLHKGARRLLAREEKADTRRELLKDLGVSLGYTALILVLLKLGVLKPIQGYFPNL